MRRDYVDPDDYEYEPTAHDECIEEAQQSNVDRSPRSNAQRIR